MRDFVFLSFPWPVCVVKADELGDKFFPWSHLRFALNMLVWDEINSALLVKYVGSLYKAKEQHQ